MTPAQRRRSKRATDKVATTAPAAPSERWPASPGSPPGEWHIALTHERTPRTPGCQPAVLSRNVYDEAEAANRGDYSTYRTVEYRGACHGCGWLGEIVISENDATEGAHAHAFPGYESLPVLQRSPHEPTPNEIAGLLALIERLYPPGWIERHGPIRTTRTFYGTRHVPGRAPTGGYDLCGAVEAEASKAPAPSQGTLF